MKFSIYVNRRVFVMRMAVYEPSHLNLHWVLQGFTGVYTFTRIVWNLQFLDCVQFVCNFCQLFIAKNHVLKCYLYIMIRAASSEKVLWTWTKCTDPDACASYHLGLCSPAMQSVVSNDPRNLIRTCAVRACPEGTFTHGAAHIVKMQRQK